MVEIKTGEVKERSGEVSVSVLHRLHHVWSCNIHQGWRLSVSCTWQVAQRIWRSENKTNSCLCLINGNPAHIPIIDDVLLMMLPNQSPTYLGNSVRLKTFMIWLPLPGSFVLSFACVSWISWVPSLSWTSRSRLSSDSTLRTNTDTSTTSHQGRQDTVQTLTLHSGYVVTGYFWQWPSIYFLSQKAIAILLTAFTEHQFG